MPFHVFSKGSYPTEAWVRKGWTVFLVRDDWNDWFKYLTTFHVLVANVDGQIHDLGVVKIGQFGMTTGSPALPESFNELDDTFFSLGQDANYYETLQRLDASRRDEVIRGLHDVASDLDLFGRALEEPVTRGSLLRYVSEDTVRKRFSQIVRGNAQLTRFAFAFEYSDSGGLAAAKLTFNVEPESMPPTNVHVLIGRNGVGKTRCLNRITRSLVLGEESPNEGRLRSLEDDGELFVNLVSVTFSAFDPFPPLTRTSDTDHRVRYDYIGLQRLDRLAQHASPKGPEDLLQDFVASAQACLVGARASRWKTALATLESDPLFAAADVSRLTVNDGTFDWSERANTLFRLLSSGHKIVLLTITRLVECVDEKTLVLLDEPEAHLHPPLLSSFIRCLSDLLVSRNGVAVIATHSPVVLQEVPRSCVWMLNRSGRLIAAERPEIETFGENVGVLTREVFGLEVTAAGFHRLLESVSRASARYEDVLSHFQGQLGSEAKAIAIGMSAAVNKGN